MLCALFYEQVREFRCLELDTQLWDRDDSVRNYAYLRAICVNAITTWRRRRNQEKMYSATRSTSAQRRYAAPAHGSRRRSTSRSKRGSRFPGRRNSRRGSPHRKTSHGARRRDVGLLADSRGVPAGLHLRPLGDRPLAPREEVRSVTTSSSGVATAAADAKSPIT